MTLFHPHFIFTKDISDFELDISLVVIMPFHVYKQTFVNLLNFMQTKMGCLVFDPKTYVCNIHQ